MLYTLKNKKQHRKNDHRMFSKNRSCAVVDPLVDPGGAAIQDSDSNLIAAGKERKNLYSLYKILQS